MTRHTTYIAAECIHCKRVAIRICILHDDCVHGGDDCKGHF